MDDRTLTALRQSIEKWERNAVAETPDDYATSVGSCALCCLFWENRCRGCPVTDATGGVRCDWTPYWVANAARSEWSDCPSNLTLRDAAHAAARAEVEFLRSLLPEEEATP